MVLNIIDGALHKLLWKLTEVFPDRTRVIKVDGLEYLRRFYITPRRLDEFGEDTEKYLGFGLYLHYFYRGDEDRELHNHPWKSAISFILSGGYHEERKEGEKDSQIIERTVRRYTFNKINHNTFHRVTKRKSTGPIWTVFLTGTRVQDWGFWDKDTNEYIPHKDFTDMTDQGYKQRNKRKARI